VFSETNLLTRCHSASSLFSAIFVFQCNIPRFYQILEGNFCACFVCDD
jgi:hypothetical protein